MAPGHGRARVDGINGQVISCSARLANRPDRCVFVGFCRCKVGELCCCQNCGKINRVQPPSSTASWLPPSPRSLSPLCSWSVCRHRTLLVGCRHSWRPRWRHSQSSVAWRVRIRAWHCRRIASPLRLSRPGPRRRTQVCALPCQRHWNVVDLSKEIGEPGDDTAAEDAAENAADRFDSIKHFAANSSRQT